MTGIIIILVIVFLFMACNTEESYTTLKIINGYTKEFTVQASIGNDEFPLVTIYPGETKTFQKIKEFYPDGKINWNVIVNTSENKTSSKSGLVLGGGIEEIIFSIYDFN